MHTVGGGQWNGRDWVKALLGMLLGMFGFFGNTGCWVVVVRWLGTVEVADVVAKAALAKWLRSTS